MNPGHPYRFPKACGDARRDPRSIREVWDLTRGYWTSNERWSAWILLGSIVGLNLGLVLVNVLLNIANGPDQAHPTLITNTGASPLELSGGSGNGFPPG